MRVIGSRQQRSKKPGILSGRCGEKSKFRTDRLTPLDGFERLKFGKGIAVRFSAGEEDAAALIAHKGSEELDARGCEKVFHALAEHDHIIAVKFLLRIREGCAADV